MSKDANWKFVDDFAAIERRLEAELEVASKNTANKATKRAQGKAPVKTGELRNSGHVGQTQHTDDTVSTEIVFEAEYAIPVHNGHITSSGSFVAPRPFLTDGLLESEIDLEREGERTLDRTFKAAITRA